MRVGVAFSMHTLMARQRSLLRICRWLFQQTVRRQIVTS